MPSPAHFPMITSPHKLLKEYDLKPKKRLGQHFLVNPFTAKQIVDAAGIKSDDIVVEIGAGLGALTIPLSKRAKGVIAIEYDKGLAGALKNEIKKASIKNVDIWIGDALKFDYYSISKKYNKKIKILGNLPYYISAPLLFLLLENSSVLSDTTIMLQKEVVKRLTARPGCKDYGILTIVFNLFAKIETLLQLLPESFYPVPKVGSDVIKIIWEEEKILDKSRENRFIKLLKTAFSQRRKTIYNALRKKLIVPQAQLKAILADLSVFKMRPEQIEPTLYVEIYKKIEHFLA